MNYLREVSKKLGHDKMFLFLIGISDKIYVFSSTGKDLIEHGVNSGMIVRELCQKLNGAGGGPPTKGEGTVPLEAKDKIDWLYKQVEDKIMERLK